MTKVEEIEQAVAWDLQIKDDSKGGRLAFLLDEASQATRNGALREF